MSIEDLIFKVRRVAGRTFIALSSDPRPDSQPFVSGDTFRSVANHLFDETHWNEPKKVLAGDIVFVSSPEIPRFFETAHPIIPNPYILISHNGDQNIGKESETHLAADIERKSLDYVLAN